MPKRLISAFLCVVILFSLASCSGKKEKEKYIIKYNLDSEPQTLDPQAATDYSARVIIMNTFLGLMKRDSAGKAVKGCAESYTVSDDEKTYTFNLYKNACWSNGTPLTARDFVFGIKRALAPSTASADASRLFSIKNAENYHNGNVTENALGVRADGEYTLIIELNSPDNDFLYDLTEPVAMPCNEEFFNSTAGQYGKESSLIISNGCFCVRQKYGWGHNEYVYLRENRYYFGVDKPKISGVDFTVGKTFKNPADAIKNGETDALVSDSSFYASAKKENIDINEFASSIWGLCFNVGESAVSDVRIRRALLSSLDRDDLLSEIPEYAEVAGNIISDEAKTDEGNYRSLAGNTALPKFDKNAKTVLKKTLAALKLEKLPGLTVLCSDDVQTGKIVSKIIASWNKISDTYVNKKPLSKNSLETKVNSHEYTVALAPVSYSGTEPTDLLGRFSTTSGGNIFGLKSGEYDNILLDIKRENTAANCFRAENFLVQNAVFYPMYYENGIFLTSENVSGIVYYPFNGGVDFTGADKLKE